MKIELGFAVNSSVNIKPCISIEIDHQVVADRITLDSCGRVDDLNAKLQYVTVDFEESPGNHSLTVRALNILDEYKKDGDFGFQVRRIRINQIDLEWFDKNSTTYNPVPNDGYIDFMTDNDLICELEYINQKPYHVKRGNYANYVNLTDGYFELKFETPLYNWFLSQGFSSMIRSLILET